MISLGTNTIRLLVIADDPVAGLIQLEHSAVGTRLGEGLGERGALGAAAIDRTLAVVAAFAERAREYDAALSCIATSAVRRATNRRAFSDRVATVCGAPLDILDGAREAACSFRGATFGRASCADRIGVLDIGGGSTECAVGRYPAIDASRSVEIGSVRLTERHPGLIGTVGAARARAAARAARVQARRELAGIAELAPVDEVRAVAGTPLTLGAIAYERDVAGVRGEQLTRAQLAAVLDRLLAASLERRRAMPGMIPQRADVLAAGAILFDVALELLGVDRATLESNDLLLGYLASGNRPRSD